MFELKEHVHLSTPHVFAYTTHHAYELSYTFIRSARLQRLKLSLFLQSPFYCSTILFSSDYSELHFKVILVTIVISLLDAEYRSA